MPTDSAYHPAPIYLELGSDFADPVAPAVFPKHVLRFRNQRWAERTGLAHLTEQEWENHFAAFAPLPLNLPQPLALRYHGHQFRSYNPDLGDGRGFLFAQLRDTQKRILDLGTKGSGPTPYSRRGDGRLTLKGAVREILATEMLEARGVVTSKTFSVFETGEALFRGDEPSPTRSAVLTRLSHSHIRFGTFQRLAAINDPAAMQKVYDYCVRHYFPDVASPVELLKEVARRTADLCASWMVAGFVHGVLNTDNMNLTGESFDYGPYRFLPKYDPAFTAAYFDHSGLYAFGRQPESVLWNLEQLALSLSLLAGGKELLGALQVFPERFNGAVGREFLARLGLETKTEAQDSELFMSAFTFMSATQIGYDQFFHDWHGGHISQERAKGSPEASLYQGEHFEVFFSLLEGYKAFAPASEAEKQAAEEYFARQQPCGLLIDEIEEIWRPIAENDDWSRLNAKIDDIRKMGIAYGNPSREFSRNTPNA